MFPSKTRMRFDENQYSHSNNRLNKGKSATHQEMGMKSMYWKV
jgi:hypothetical protein